MYMHAQEELNHCYTPCKFAYTHLFLCEELDRFLVIVVGRINFLVAENPGSFGPSSCCLAAPRSFSQVLDTCPPPQTLLNSLIPEKSQSLLKVQVIPPGPPRKIF